jgi:hypothetical protein
MRIEALSFLWKKGPLFISSRRWTSGQNWIVCPINSEIMKCGIWEEKEAFPSGEGYG